VFQVLILNLSNLYEVSLKTGRSTDELQAMYYFAEESGESVVFTIEITEWRIHDRHRL